MNRRTWALTLGALACTLAPAAGAQPLDPDRLAALEYRFIGPDGNRAIAVAGVPGEPSTVYVGAASGGIFRTADGGVSREPIFDARGVPGARSRDERRDRRSEHLG